MDSSEDPAKRVGANDLSIPDLRKLAVPFRASGTVGPVTVARLKSNLEDAFDELGFDVASDFGPTEPPVADRFQNREPGSGRHALQGIMVGERGLSKDRRTAQRNLVVTVSLFGMGIVFAALIFTVFASTAGPLFFFLAFILIVAGLLSLPRTHAFESDIVYVWYGYDPPGFVPAHSFRGLEKEMPTSPQTFDVHVGAGRVASADVRGKGMVGRRVRRVVKASGDLEGVPSKVLRRLSGSSPLKEAAE